MSTFEVSAVQFTAATGTRAHRGLVGYVTITLDDALVLDDLTLRRNRRGALSLYFPSRKDAWGQRHPYVRLCSEKVRSRIEAQVLQALAQEEGVL